MSNKFFNLLHNVYERVTYDEATYIKIRLVRLGVGILIVLLIFLLDC